MPRQNRITPFGEIISSPARGTLMGNRGILHDEQGILTTKRWTHQNWVACRLEYKGIKRELNAPNRYTELFFLDEATALAAGHRPCAECRREDFHRFREAWLRGNPDRGLDESSSIAAVDRVIHAERVTRTREKVVWAGRLGDLPDTVFVALQEKPDKALLKWRGNLYCWNPEGYRDPFPVEEDRLVTILTPRSIAMAIKAGYTPAVLIEG
ncbi:MAG: hypothetical protein ED859_03800 [Desulfuromonadales bacterium]|nr:MAG: hypothetical protein ED859_03800 [Desulfuromonadales bacterium]